MLYLITEMRLQFQFIYIFIYYTAKRKNIGVYITNSNIDMKQVLNVQMSCHTTNDWNSNQIKIMMIVYLCVINCHSWSCDQKQPYMFEEIIILVCTDLLVW